MPHKDGVEHATCRDNRITPVAAMENMDVCDTSQSSSEATTRQYKSYEDLTSPYRRRMRLKMLTDELAKLGWTTNSLLAAAEDLEEQRMDKNLEGGASDEPEEVGADGEEEEPLVPQPGEQAPFDATMLARLSWDRYGGWSPLLQYYCLLPYKYSSTNGTCPGQVTVQARAGDAQEEQLGEKRQRSSARQKMESKSQRKGPGRPGR